jgi:hypothetical protein
MLMLLLMMFLLLMQMLLLGKKTLQLFVMLCISLLLLTDLVFMML